MHKSNMAGVKGVARDRNRWRARIVFEGKRIGLGSFVRIEDAAAAYTSAARALFGEFARTSQQ